MDRAGPLPNLEENPVNLRIMPLKKYDNKKEFSREVVWYGRKGGKFFHPVTEVKV